MKLQSLYEEVFRSGFSIESRFIETHIERLKELDKVLPPSSTFIIITNTTTQQYHYITKNFKFCTGHKKETFYEKGIPYWLENVHPKDIQLWVTVLAELMTFCLTEVTPSERLKLDFQYNYRLKTASGGFVNVLENQIPIHLDNTGKPIIGLGHFTVFGQGEEVPLKGTLRQLNAHDEYETLITRNFSQKLLTDGLTNRENDIVRLVALGHSSQQIADKLFISKETVKSHRKNVLKKLNLSSSIDIITHFKNNNFF